MNHKETIQLILQQASHPLTRQEIGLACNGATVNTIKKHLRTFRESGEAYIADWVTLEYHNSIAPRWIWGKGVDATKPRKQGTKRRPERRPEQVIQFDHPLIPKTPYKTIFIGANPWLANTTSPMENQNDTQTSN